MLLGLGSVATYGQQRICIGTSKNYGVDQGENFGNGTPGSVYSWRVIQSEFQGQISNRTTSGNKVTVDWAETPTGIYTLEVTELDNCGAEMVKSLEVHIQENITLDLPPINYLCPNYGLTQLSAPQDFDTYAWYNEAGDLVGVTRSIEVTEAGQYRLVVTSGVCTTEATTTVELVEFPTFVVSSDVNDALVVVASGGNTNVLYQLELPDGTVVSPWQYSTRFRNVRRGKYLVRVKSVNGDCYIDLQTEAFVLTNVITPNNDGINDVWDLSRVLANYPDAEVEVYNRYGKLIKAFGQFEEFKWDGKINGQPISTDNYWYKIDLKNGQFLQGSLLIKNY